MTEETNTPTETPKENIIGKVQVTGIWLSPSLEKEMMMHNHLFEQFSQVQLRKDTDGSFRFIVAARHNSTALRSLTHWLVAFSERQIKNTP
jgi:hypothetical protein